MSAILLLDNKDSFVWNLAQALQTLGQEVTVVRSDAITPDDLASALPLPRALVISPGPGRPATAGHSVELIRRMSGRVPILGVCLGHQAIATAFGGRIVRVPPCHGKPWPVRHEGTGLYRGLPNPMQACRYHSLAVDPAIVPAELQVDADNPEGIIMGLRHRSHPTFGVQFHPESFRSPDGIALLQNFLDQPQP